MKKENSKIIFSRIIKNSIIIEGASLVFIFFFTKDLLCCIISFMAAFLSVAGFLVMILIIDKYTKEKCKLSFFFFISSSKFILITLGFYLASIISLEAALFFLLGISVIVMGIIGEAFYQIYRNFVSGRT